MSLYYKRLLRKYLLLHTNITIYISSHFYDGNRYILHLGQMIGQQIGIWLGFILKISLILKNASSVHA